METYGIGIAALQEVRWPRQGECNIDNRATLFYSGSDSGHHVNGTGFLIRNSLLGNVLRFVAVSDRICLLRLKSRFSHITIINAYAPTEISSEAAKDSFYEDLEALYDQANRYDVKILIGDFNAQIGREEAFVPTIGRHSKHNTSNDNGLRLITFATSKSLVIKSTMFPHKEIYKGTWKSPDGMTVNQIDHVLIDDRHKSIIQDVRSYRGADCDSDHYLQVVKIKPKINTKKRAKVDKEDLLDVEKLKDPAIGTQFQIETSNKFSELKVDETDIEDLWKNVKDTAKQVGLQTIGRRKRKKKKWWTEDCEKIVEDRRRLRILAEQDPRQNQLYNDFRRQAKRVIRQAKRIHLAKKDKRDGNPDKSQ
ncbi:PREDICTED: craniofacial development protein 2-like [Papilio xuthus]|uniref:Craniofacial development protein 2-like n=1 Tax=Papilio xuthus TaxID=66420 RepID=A0AAJ6ZL02_PAPXU|nr:PREDICTED: craniofacial development protein 2-like [Papilio xuthus]